MRAHGQSSPLRQALRATMAFALAAVVIRLMWGAFDPEVRSYSLVALAPLGGLLAYLYESGRRSAIATLLIGIGIGGLIFWTWMLRSNRWPTTPEDLPYVIVVFAFPAAALGMGLYQRRQLRRTHQSPSA